MISITRKLQRGLFTITKVSSIRYSIGIRSLATDPTFKYQQPFPLPNKPDTPWRKLKGNLLYYGIKLTNGAQLLRARNCKQGICNYTIL